MATPEEKRSSRALPIVQSSESSGGYLSQIVESLLDAQVPTENTATCSSCAMIGHKQASAATSFNEEVKCCSYYPVLHNFQVGAILANSPSPQAKSELIRRISAEISLSPLHVLPLASTRVIYERTRKQAFGRAASLRCPYFENGTGSCLIWKWRNSICLSWHCKHDRGRLGSLFWQALGELAEELETAIANWCMNKVGLENNVEELKRYSSNLDNLLLEEQGVYRQSSVHANMWQGWRDSKEDYYLECWHLVRDLTSTEVLAIGGATLRQKIAKTNQLLDQLAKRSMPEVLWSQRISLAPGGSGNWLIQTYSELDPLIAPAVLLSALSYFDGRPVSAVLADIESQLQLELDESLIAKLLDFGALGPQPSNERIGQ